MPIEPRTIDARTIAEGVYRAVFGPMGAPNGTSVFNNPYASNQFMQWGMETGNAEIGMALQMFLPMLAPMISGGRITADRFTNNSGALLSNVLRAQQMTAAVAEANKAGQAGQIANITSLLGNIMPPGMAEFAASSLVQFGGAIDPRITQILNRLDISGGSLGLGENVVGALTATGRRTDASTAAAVTRYLQQSIQRKDETGLTVLDTKATAGYTAPEMALIMRELVASGRIGDIGKAVSAEGVLEAAIGSGRFDSDKLSDVVRRLRSGEITETDAFRESRALGVTDDDRLNFRNEAVQRSVNEAQPAMRKAAESLKMVGSVFDTISDNIPELLKRMSDLVDTTKGIDKDAVALAVGRFGAIVEATGTTSEELYRHMQILRANLGVSSGTALEIAGTTRMAAKAYERGGASKDSSEQLASELGTIYAGMTKSSTADMLRLAQTYGSDEVKARLAQAEKDLSSSDPAVRVRALELIDDPSRLVQEYGLAEGVNVDAYRRMLDRAAAGELTDAERRIFDAQLGENNIARTAAAGAMREKARSDIINGSNPEQLEKDRRALSKRFGRELTQDEAIKVMAAMAAGFDEDKMLSIINDALSLSGEDRVNVSDLAGIKGDTGSVIDIETAVRYIAADANDPRRVSLTGMARSIENQLKNRDFSQDNGTDRMLELMKKAKRGEVDFTDVLETTLLAAKLISPTMDIKEGMLGDEQLKRMRDAHAEFEAAQKSGDKDRITRATEKMDMVSSDVAMELIGTGNGVTPEQVRNLISRQRSEAEDEPTERSIIHGGDGLDLDGGTSRDPADFGRLDGRYDERVGRVVSSSDPLTDEERRRIKEVEGGTVDEVAKKGTEAVRPEQASVSVNVPERITIMIQDSNKLLDNLKAIVTSEVIRMSEGKK